MGEQATNFNGMTCGIGSRDAPGAGRGFDRARLAMWVRIVSAVLIVLGLLAVVRTLPLAAGITWLEDWLEGLGLWAPLAFAAIYVVAAVLFVPGGALTILAGVLFGLLWGVVTVSLASTTAAAVAFLIGRYLARDAVRAQAEQYPKFGAVDRAIGEGGWKIVLMLRLVPLFPFSTGNYLLGLTPVRFWGYVLASWIGMLPGTFVFIYLGHVGRRSAEAVAAGVDTGMDPLEWALMIGGGVVAIGVVVYITRLVRRKLAEQTDLDTADEAPSREREAPAAVKPGVTVGLAGAAVLMIGLGACATVVPDWVNRWFGPPAVVMVEAYEQKPDGAVFDHSLFASVLEQYVNEAGGVDYAGLAENPDDLLAYNASLADAPWEEMGRNEKLALLLNAYNSFTLELMIDWLPRDGIEGIRDIPASERWEAERWNVAGNVWSLDQIEHEQIRQHFIEPDYHWAAVCAAVGCPPLRLEPYTGEQLDEQLREQARLVHTDGTRWFQYDRDAGVLHLTPLYRWYRGDFEQVKPDILTYAAQYNDALAADIEAGRRPSVQWLDYDWSLNDQEALP